MLVIFGLSSMNFAETVDAIGTTAAENEALVSQEVPLNNEGYPLLASYTVSVPDNMNIMEIDYNQYNIAYSYVVSTRNTVNIRQQPTTSSPVVKQLGFYGKINVFEKVTGQYFKSSDSDEWFRVYWYKGDEIKTGYIYAPIVTFREFRLNLASEKIKALEDFFETHDNMGKVNNYKHYNGYAPRYHGKTVDAFGYSRDQSAPMYDDPANSDEFRYVLDGMIFNIQSKANGYYYVYVPDFDAYGYIPSKFVSVTNQVKKLDQLIFVDNLNQNIFTLQKTDGTWFLKSLSYATTGKLSEYKEPTVPGFYAAIQKKDSFLYLDDKTDELDGYAPYAIRFNGGAYLHGFPVNYRWNTEQVLVEEPEFDDQGIMIKEAVYEEERVGSPIDPGMIEYSYTLGTVPLSHKCVRNPTSHAKYMYDWIKLDECIVVIIE